MFRAWRSFLRKNQIIRAYSQGQGPPAKMIRAREMFQKDDGVPVYIKAGARDKALLGLTVTLLVIGLADSIHTIYQMAKPKKK